MTVWTVTFFTRKNTIPTLALKETVQTKPKIVGPSKECLRKNDSGIIAGATPSRIMVPNIDTKLFTNVGFIRR